MLNVFCVLCLTDMSVMCCGTAYPAVYGQFPQAIAQPMAGVAASQREGKYLTLPVHRVDTTTFLYLKNLLLKVRN